MEITGWVSTLLIWAEYKQGFGHVNGNHWLGEYTADMGWLQTRLRTRQWKSLAGWVHCWYGLNTNKASDPSMEITGWLSTLLIWAEDKQGFGHVNGNHWLGEYTADMGWIQTRLRTRQWKSLAGWVHCGYIYICNYYDYDVRWFPCCTIITMYYKHNPLLRRIHDCFPNCCRFSFPIKCNIEIVLRNIQG